MKIVFMGSASLACGALRALLARSNDSSNSVALAMVITQPDRPKGRSLQVAACPARELAQAHGVPTLTPENVNDPETLSVLEKIAPDLIVVVAYGQILRKNILALPRKGCVNVHASLLPHYRGAAPIQWAIVNGETVTGVTTMYMAEEMDAGDIIQQVEVPVDREDTGGTLHDKLMDAGAALLVETIDAIQAGRQSRTAQDVSRVTFAPKLKKEHGRIDWTLSAGDIYNRVRGFNPWPSCFCFPHAEARESTRLKVLEVETDDRAGDPGTVLDLGEAGPLIAAGKGSVRLVRVQPEGKKVMRGGDYARGRKIAEGGRFC